MAAFPRTMIEGVSVPRMIAGTNWFLGFSHTSKAKDDLIREMATRERIADIMEAFMRAGIDAILGFRPDAVLIDALKQAEDRTGKACIKITTPHFDLSGTPEAGSNNERTVAELAELGCAVCMPHQQITDALADRRSRTIRDLDTLTSLIRDHGMVPGLSTHMPETPVYADETDADVATYIQIYNAAGFLMQVEADWVHRLIWRAKHPVITIKPLAAGRLLPLVGLAFSWSTIRDRDMVCIGTSSPDEAREVIDISLSLLERRAPEVELQRTRSKESL